ncbi:PAF acetylhydrolase family protein, partial [Aureobasidium melanogenum]
MKLLLLFFSATLASAIVVQPPLGRYGVASAVMELVDTSRNDTYASKPEPRRIMVSSYYPTNSPKKCQPVMLPYMPPATAAVYDQMYAPIGILNGTFGSFELSTCVFNRKDRSRGPSNFPVVLFSPGLGNSRLLYGAMAQSLASHGYVVITMDHAYDANIVEYPDESIVLAVNIETTEQITADVVARQRDVSFLIDQLHNCSIRQQLFHDIASSESLNKILMMGHSLGGATAAATMLADNRIAAAVNLDGTMFGDVLNEGLRSPFMIMSHQGKNLTTDPSWARVWPEVTGSKLVVTLNGTIHGSYSDLPLLANTLGLSAKASAQVEELLGTMDGKTAMENINAFVGHFFKCVERKMKNLLPSDMAKQFPQATVLDMHVCK